MPSLSLYKYKTAGPEGVFTKRFHCIILRSSVVAFYIPDFTPTVKPFNALVGHREGVLITTSSVLIMKLEFPQVISALNSSHDKN